MNVEVINIILPAFVAGLLIIATHVPLGLEVMKRGIIFIDLAVAQIAGLGVVVASLYFHSQEDVVLTQIMAFLFAISAAYSFKICEKYFPHLQESIIGSAYVFASSLTLILLAKNPHGADQVQNLLSGQLLWVSWNHIVITASIYAILLVAIFNKKLLTKYFYIIFAITITLSVQLAGVYLVFASLILPAIGATIYKKPNKLSLGYGLSLISLVAGLIISLITDLPTGPILVCTLFIIVIIFSLWACFIQTKNLNE